MLVAASQRGHSLVLLKTEIKLHFRVEHSPSCYMLGHVRIVEVPVELLKGATGSCSVNTVGMLAFARPQRRGTGRF